MDKLAETAKVGLVKTVADGMKPGSDVANLSVLGYDPKIYYTGRSPLEAGSIGIDMKKTDVSLRCNLVTVTDEPEYSDKTIVDYCADDISTEEAAILIKYLAENLDNDEFKFYSGVSYRHCLIWNNGTLDIGTITPPHDITGKPVKNYVPAHPNAAKLYDLMKKSYDLLKDHPVNKAREERGLRPANSIWLWGEGVRANLDDFKGKYGLNGSMISAVDLLKGIGKFSDMGQLLSYNAATNGLTVIFSFYDKDNADRRTLYDHHGIKILDVDEGGNVKFAVYGYMNRGRHEGETGIQIISYDNSLNTIEEEAYIPYSKSYAVLKEEMEQLLYRNRQQQLSLGKLVYCN